VVYAEVARAGAGRGDAPRGGAEPDHAMEPVGAGAPDAGKETTE
jgi:hypothetical protein